MQSSRRNFRNVSDKRQNYASGFGPGRRGTSPSKRRQPGGPPGNSGGAPHSPQNEFQDAAKSYVDRLNKKIRHQAAELAEFSEKLEAAEAYGALAERRVRQFCPTHPLPVNATHLTEPPPSEKVLARPLPNGRSLTGMAEQAALHQEEVAKLKAIVRDEREQRQRAEKRISEIEAGLEAYSRDVEAACRQKNGVEVAHLRGEMVAKEVRLEALEKDLERSRKEAANLRIKANRFGTELRGAKQEINSLQGSAVAKLTKRIHELESERDALLDYVQEQIKKADELNTQLKATASEKNRLEDERLALKDNAARLDKESSNLQQVVSRLRSKEKEANDLDNQVQKLDQELKGVKEEMSELGKFQDELLKNLQASNQENINLKEDMVASQSKIEELENETKGLKLNLEEASSEIKRAKDSAKAMEKRAKKLSIELKATKDQASFAQSRFLDDAEVGQEISRLENQNQQSSQMKQAIESLVREVQRAPAMPVSLENGPGIVASAAWCTHSLWRQLHPTFYVRLKSVHEIIGRLVSDNRGAKAEMEQHDFQRKRLISEMDTLESRERALAEREQRTKDRMHHLQQQVADCTGSVDALREIHSIVIQSEDFETAVPSSVDDGNLVQLVPELVHEIVKDKSALLLRCRGIDTRARELEGQLRRLAEDNERLRSGARAAEESLGKIRNEANRNKASNHATSQSLRRELENAAELAECQHALATTLGGRMEAVTAERNLLHSQAESLRLEIEEAEVSLSQGLTEALEALRTNPCRLHAFRSLAARTQGIYIEKDLRRLCGAVCQFLTGLEQALAEAEELYVATDQAKTKAMRLQALIKTLEVSNKASVDELEATRIQLRTFEEMTKMGLGGVRSPSKFARIKSPNRLPQAPAHSNIVGAQQDPPSVSPRRRSPKVRWRENQANRIKDPPETALADIQGEFKRINNIRKGRTPSKINPAQYTDTFNSGSQKYSGAAPLRLVGHDLPSKKTPSQGISHLQERLKSAQATFNFLRKTAEL